MRNMTLKKKNCVSSYINVISQKQKYAKTNRKCENQFKGQKLTQIFCF